MIIYGIVCACGHICVETYGGRESIHVYRIQDYRYGCCRCCEEGVMGCLHAENHDQCRQHHGLAHRG